MFSYDELKGTADQRWKDLTQGDMPWIRVGTEMNGHAAGGFQVIDAIRSELGARNIAAYVDEVGTLGLSYAEPIVDVLKPGRRSRLLFRDVLVDDLPEIIDKYIVNDSVPGNKAFAYLGEEPIQGVPDLRTIPQYGMQQRVAMRNAGHIAPADIYQYIANDGYAALNKALFEIGADTVIEEMKASNLRGRGGAGFPTGLKWSFMVNSPGPIKYIACNCEEGDPGAFNDKAILESDPHTLLEGMLLAGFSTGASNGFGFIRHGHDGPIDCTERAIEQAYELGILCKNIMGSDFSFDIEVSLTGDSYVAGEETALMESSEGKRSMPRFKPPFPAAAGIWQKPTTINNVKTLAYAPQIILNGSEWFSGIGPEKSTGTAIACLPGHIAYPGIYEVPMGLTIGQVINTVGGGVPGGKSLKLLQTGGPLGGVLGPDSLDVKIDFDDMAAAGAIFGSGGLIVGNEDTSVVDLIRVLVTFCQYESCGKCFPCRLGMTQLLDIMERIARFEGKPEDLDVCERLGKTMQIGSLCAHGQLGFNPIKSALTHFISEFEEHLNERRDPTGRTSTKFFSPKATRPYSEDFREVQPLEVISSL